MTHLKQTNKKDSVILEIIYEDIHIGERLWYFNMLLYSLSIVALLPGYLAFLEYG